MRTRSRFEFNKGAAILNGSFSIIHKLGSGNFGQVFMVSKTSVKNQQQLADIPDKAAMKVEKDVEDSEMPQMTAEAKVLKHLNEGGGCEGIPQVYYEGNEKGNNMILMELLGPTLHTLLQMCGGTFSLKTSLLLMFQILQRMQHIHEKGYIYCDIKPENFLMGVDDKSHILYVVDFGLCKKYQNAETGLHQPYKENKRINGTLRYASIASQYGIIQSRRDDLQSVCYLLLYFLKGKLPWEGYPKGINQAKGSWILTKKLKTTAAQLCQGLPYQIQSLVEYCQEMEYFEDPNYAFMTHILKQLYIRQGFKFDYDYDWTMLKTKKQRRKQPISVILYDKKQVQDSQENY